MKKKWISACGVFLGVFLFAACEKVSLDNEKPVVTVTGPAVDEVVMPGSALHFEVEFTDNEALASYKVNIHGAFDGHTHDAGIAGTARKSHAESSGTGLAGDGMRAAATDKEVQAQGAATRAAADSVTFERTWLERDFVALGETPIAGKKQAAVAHRHIVIPATINGLPLREGHYHFTVYCTDRAGQESFVSREIVLSYDPAGHRH